MSIGSVGGLIYEVIMKLVTSSALASEVGSETESAHTVVLPVFIESVAVVTITELLLAIQNAFR